jgi:hypothetical protein
MVIVAFSQARRIKHSEVEDAGERDLASQSEGEQEMDQEAGSPS